MIVTFHSTGGNNRINVLHPAWDGIPFNVADSLQDFASRLFRDPDASGILHCHLSDMAAQIVSSIRLGNVKNCLLVTVPDDGDIGRASQRRGDILLAGADDAQPCSIDERELVLRMKAIAGRGDYIDHLHIALPSHSIFDFETGQIETRDGRSIRVTPTESAILVDLARRPGETRTKQQIMDAIYGGEDEPEMKIIDVLVCKLRRKIIEATGGVDVVQTIWGRGYQFVPDGFQPVYRPNRWRAAR